MSASKHKPVRFKKLNRRSFFLVGLLIVGALFFLNQQRDALLPLFTRYTHSLRLNVSKLEPQGLSNKLSAVLDNICLWSRGVYESNIDDSRWLVNRWLALAVIMGLLVPTVISGLFFIIKGIRGYFEKTEITNKYLSGAVKYIKRKTGRAYHRSVLRSWEQVTLIILALGIGLFSLQLLAANLWRWDKGVGWSSLFLFILYAHWAYYNHLGRQGVTKKHLLSQIDSRLGLKQGLVTLLETKNFNASPRFYKLLLGEVFYRIKPANFANILSYKFSWSAKRDLAVPLLLIISLSGLVSVVHPRLGIMDKLERFFSLDEEPKSIEKLLAQEANSLRILTTELQHTQADQPEMAYIIDNLNELAAEFTYLAGNPLDTNQKNQYADSQATKAGLLNKPAVDQRPLNWYEDNTPKRGKGRPKKPDTPDVGQKMPPSALQDWPEASPPGEGIINLPLRSGDKYYQAASAEVNKMAQALLALKADGKDVLDRRDNQQLTLDKGLPMAPLLAGYLADGPEGAATESPQSETGGKELRDNKAGADKGQSSQEKPESSPLAENPASRAPALQPIVSALDQIGNKLSKIKLYEAAEEEGDNQTPGKTRPLVQSPTQGEVVNRIQLKPIKTEAKTEQKQEETPEGVMMLERPHHLEIDPQPNQHPSAAGGGDERFPMPDHPPSNLKQKIKVNARRIEELGRRLLMVSSPEHISFNPQKGKAISSLWEKVRISIKRPKDIDNRFSQVTERVQGVDDPRQIVAITSELAKLSRKFSTWGMDSGNKLSRLRPDLAQLTRTDSLGRKVSKPLPEGGPDKADRQAVIIRGKREQAWQESSDLERIRVEESPKHLPTHDIAANVSVELNQVANRLENVDVASIKANMRGVNLRDFVIEKQRTLEILNNQLARAKDFSSVTQVTNKLADLSAQLGKLALDSTSSAEFLANQQAVQKGQKLRQDTTDRELIDKINRDGRELLELSQRIKQEMDAKSRANTAYQMLNLAKGLAGIDFEQIILKEGKDMLDLAQLAQQLSDLSPRMQTATPYQGKLPQPGKDKALMETMLDGANRLQQIKRRLESAKNRQEREELGLELLKLAQMLRGNVSESSNEFLRTVSTKAITSLGDQIKEVGEQLRSNAADYQSISARLQQIAGKLKGRSQELTATQLASSQDIAQLSSNLSQLAQRLKKIGPDTMRQQDTAEEPASDQLDADMSQQAIGRAAQDLLKVSQDLAGLSDNSTSEYADQLREIINELKGNDSSGQLDQQALEGLRRELAQLAQGLRQAGLEPENAAVSEELPQIARELAELSPGISPNPLDTRQLASQLSEVYAELKRLDSARYSSELASTEDLGSRLRQISKSIRDLPSTELREITATLDSLGKELLAVNIPARKAAPHRQLNAEQNGTLAGSTADASRRKKEIALKNIDQAVKRLKDQYRKTNDRYNPGRGLKGLNLVTKGIAKASRGMMDKLKDSLYNRANFTADKVAKQIDVAPEKETVSNAYPMERNLADPDVFRRVIERLEDKRERINRFGASAPVESTASRRTGAFNQPQNLDYEGRMRTMTGRESKPTAVDQETRMAFLEKPKSYHPAEDLNPYTHKLPVSPKDIDEAKLSNLPLEKQKPSLKIQPDLTLHAQQTPDKASQRQLVPLMYREIIKKLYLD